MEKSIIDIDARSWQSVLDFYDDVLRRLGAPEWHGQNVNALVDSMIFGGINSLEPPYVIRIHDTAGLSDEITEELRVVMEALAEARLHRQESTGVDVGVAFEIVQNP